MIGHHGAYCDGTLLPTEKHFPDGDAYLIDVNSMIDLFLLIDIKNDGKKNTCQIYYVCELRS